MFDDVMLRRVVVRPLFVLIFAIHGLRTLFDVELCSFLNCNSVSKGFGTPGKYFWPPLYVCEYLLAYCLPINLCVVFR